MNHGYNEKDFQDRYLEALRYAGISVGIPMEIFEVKPTPCYPESITIVKVDDGVVRRINLDNGETIITIIRDN